jgi:hypothetical protein
MRITGNEPAMPTANSDRGIDFGLTIRQHYAGLAMQGILSQISSNPNHYDHCKYLVNDGYLHYESVAKDAVALSDALIAEINKD